MSNQRAETLADQVTELREKIDRLERERDLLRDRVTVLRAALDRCARFAGNPDPAEACRVIIAEIKGALPNDVTLSADG